MDRTHLCGAIRNTLIRLPAPYENHYGVVPPAPPEEATILGKEKHRVDRALAAIAEIDRFTSSINDPYYIGRILIRQEAVSSSSIEGTNSTLDELLRVEEDVPDSRAEAKQVRDYAVLMEHIIARAAARKEEIFDLDLLSEIHREVMKNDTSYRHNPGSLRDIVVWIGGTRADIGQSIYNPPPPSEVRGCLDDTISYMRAEGMQAMTQSIVERMAIAHAHFEGVHPFPDGNGRSGRILMPIMMAAEGHSPLYLSPYIEANKSAYGSALKDAQQRLNWVPMIGLIADAIVATVGEINATRAALAKLADEWRSRRKFRAKSASLLALDWLPNYPVITASRLMDMLGIPAVTANKAIEQLVDSGILVERTGFKRNRIFAAEEALRIINRKFGDPIE